MRKISVANRPKFRPKNTKVAPEKSQRPAKSAAELSADFTKYAWKRAELFYVCYYLKILDNFAKVDHSIHWFTRLFSYYCASRIFVNANKISFFKTVCVRPKFCCHRLNFLVDLAENICHEVATSTNIGKVLKKCLFSRLTIKTQNLSYLQTKKAYIQEQGVTKKSHVKCC
jgi:hypothetical protein